MPSEQFPHSRLLSCPSIGVSVTKNLVILGTPNGVLKSFLTRRMF
jgi:hypothetical protein